VLTVVNL